MKLSKLIKLLQDALKQNGDLEVIKSDEVYGEAIIEEVEVTKDIPYSKVKRKKPVLMIWGRS